MVGVFWASKLLGSGVFRFHAFMAVKAFKVLRV